ncbi:hypothetical protein ACKW6Q_03750 [Chryseobacterium kwangjuense]|uniref:Bacterial Pleckstrin homology domain-containing protein n=1 Tax=Chryseobacterium kwangjuense TaxID=267125 RepID=A0ABW9JYC5_9FLAO
MESTVISEKKKSVITDIILLILFGGVPLFFLIKWLIQVNEGRGFIIFLIIVALFFPLVYIGAYIFDVKRKIILSEDGVRLCYGRNVVSVMNSGGSFAIPPDAVIPWSTITEFDIAGAERREPVEGGGYATTKYYDLIIKIRNFDKPGNNYYALELGRFEEHPDTILKICRKFQQNLKI